MRKRNKELIDENQPVPEKLLGKFRSVFNFNTIIYEFETHYKIYVMTGIGEKFVGVAQKDDTEISLSAYR